MWSPAQQKRLAVEEQILANELPQFRLHNRHEDTFISGYQGANGSSRRYELKLTLTRHYPFEMPSLYVVSPFTLWKRCLCCTINAEGTSHAFHTRPNGLGGCVQICHFIDWVSTNTCLAVLQKGILWIQAYENHRSTGEDIADFLGNNAKTRRF